MSNINTSKSASWADRRTRAGADAGRSAKATKMGHVSNGSFKSPQQVRADRLARRRERQWAKNEVVEQNASAETDSEKSSLEPSQQGSSNPDTDRTKNNDRAELSPQVTKQGAETGAPGTVSLSALERDEEITRLVGEAREEAQKVGGIQDKVSKKIESLTGTVVYHLKRLIEQFEVVHGSVCEAALTAYLDQQQVPRDKRDRHIYARVARLLKQQIKPGHRNKIGNILAGANLLGIRSDQLPDTYREGIQIASKKARSTGPSALGKAYKAHERAQKQAQACGACRAAEAGGAVQVGSASAGSSLFESVRKVSDGIEAGEIAGHVQGRNGRCVRIARIEWTDEGIEVFEAA